MPQPKTLYETTMPLLVANFVVGLGIWPGRTKWHTIVSAAYPLLCLVSFSVLTKISMMYVNTDFHRKTTTEYYNDVIVLLALYYTNICLTLCLIITGWWRIKTMRIAFKRITACEKDMEQIGIRKNYRNFYMYQFYVLGLVVMILLLFITIHCFMMFQEPESDMPFKCQIIVMIVTHYPIVLLYVADVTFLHWVRYSRIRFEQLNNLLRRMLTTTADSPQHKRVLRMKDEWNKTIVTSATKQQDRNTDDNTDTIRAVKQVHLELIKCSRTTNEAYGIQILFSMTVSFVFITSLLFSAYTIFWTDYTKEKLYQNIIMIVCWILFYASKIFIINHMCALASIEAASTGDIICELYEPSTSKEFRAEIRDFTLQLIQNPLVFTACGFFTLDHTFIHGVIGSITTYLVILIQVGDIPPSQTFGNVTMLNNITDFMTDISI